ncbi:MAG: type II secretion system F family protein [Candidatus Hydrothermota bacterium]|nr:MAG: type II secretion system F family protein [Candidatus Hydrothermae bacterium]
MPTFSWTGRLARQPVSGKIKAKSLEEAILRLRERGVIIETIHEVKGGLTLTFLQRITAKDLAVISRQFSTMINAGIPVVQCLEILAEQTTKEKLRSALYDIKREVEGGKTLADALRKYKNIFGDFFISMVEVGEMGGSLGSTLSRVADYYEKVTALQGKVKGAMAYPMVVLVVTIGVLVLMLTKLVPTFAALYAETGAELPGPTQLLLNVSTFVKNNFVYGISLLFAIVFISKRALHNPAIRFRWDALTLRIPIFGGLLRKTAVSRFARTLGLLIRNGVPILQSLEITARVAGNKVIEKAVLDARRNIGEGKSLTGPLRDSGVFPPMVIHLVNVGEQTGRLSEMLDKIADFYEEEVDAAVSALASVIEPVMLVFLGGLVGGMLIALYLPIFSLAGTIQE